MNLLKHTRLFGRCVVPVLVLGLFFVLQSSMDRENPQNPSPPNTVAPGGLGPGSPSIIPSNRDTTKIEYRNI